MQAESTLTCPKCSHQAVETMPSDACQFFYDCKGCGERLKPLAGDCCVFCSYGSRAMPADSSGELLSLGFPALNYSEGAAAIRGSHRPGHGAGVRLDPL